MKYILLRKHTLPGFSNWNVLLESEDIQHIIEKYKDQIMTYGVPIKELRIVKEVDYEFKCALNIRGEHLRSGDIYE